MKLLLKLMIVVVAVALLLPILRPGAPVSEVVSAAIEDVSSFCDRNETACMQGEAIAVRAGDLVVHALRSLTADTPTAQPLTEADRALEPGTAAPAQQPAIATHNDPPRP